MNNITGKSKFSAWFDDAVKLGNKRLIDNAALMMPYLWPGVREENKNTL